MDETSDPNPDLDTDAAAENAEVEDVDVDADADEVEADDASQAAAEPEEVEEAPPPPGGAGLILIVGPPRCGTTVVFDAIRSHPFARIERSSAMFHRLTRGSHNRYPRDLCVQSGGIRIEQRPKDIVRVPAFGRTEDQNVGGWMVEKLHPHFFLQDVDWITTRLTQLEKAGAPVRVVLRTREPKEMLRSQWAYKRRVPSWQTWLPEPSMVEFARSSFECMQQLAEARPDAIKSVFEDGDDAGQVERLYEALWPNDEWADKVEEPWGEIAGRVMTEAAVGRRGARAIQRFTRGGETDVNSVGEDEQFAALLKAGAKDLRAAQKAYRAFVG